MTNNVLRLLPQENQGDPSPAVSSAADQAAPVLHETLALVIAGGAALRMLMTLLPEAARNVEYASQDLTGCFKTLAESANVQSEMVQALLATIGTLEIEGKRVPLDEFIALFSKTLDDAVSKLLFVSKKALSMIYSMDDAIKNLHEIENFSKKIQVLTKQSNLLALNATIEAQRAGEAGKAFSVVASEVKMLSKEVTSLSEDMRSRTGIIMKSVMDGFNVLKEVATTDMNANIMAKDTLESLMKGLVKQSDESIKVMQESAASSKSISNSIQGMIVNLQFQDRNTQIAENAVGIIGYCLGVFDDIWSKEKAMVASGVLSTDAPGVQKAVDDLFSVIKLGDIQNLYLEILKNSGVATAANQVPVESPPIAKDIELF